MDFISVKNIDFYIDKDGDLEIDFSDYDYGTSVYIEPSDINKLVQYLNRRIGENAL